MRTILGFALALFASSAVAGPCAGFVDVEDTSPFCGNVAWIRNRAITLGCGPNAYCPDNPVTRQEMAAFISRLAPMTAPALVDANQSLVGYYVLAPAWSPTNPSLGVYPLAAVPLAGSVHYVPLTTLEDAGLLKFTAQTWEIWYELANCDASGRVWVPQGQGPAFANQAAALVNLGPGMGLRLAALGDGAGVPPTPTPQSRRDANGSCLGWVQPWPWPWSRKVVQVSATEISLPLRVE